MPTCQDCQFWIEQTMIKAPRPGGIQTTDLAIVTAPRQGECRGQPPTPILQPILNRMTGEMVDLKQLGVTYQRLNGDTPICGVFKVRLASG